MTNRMIQFYRGLIAVSLLSSIACSSNDHIFEGLHEKGEASQHQPAQRRNLSDPRIYGGVNAEIDRYPYFVRLVGGAQCGGALIAPDVVITAAHCEGDVDYVEVGRYDITDREVPFPIRQIERTIPHPDWAGNIPYNDIMLVKLDRVVDGPIVSINRNEGVPATEGEDLTVLGFGNTNPDEFNVILSTILQKIETGYVPFESCAVARDPDTGNAYGNSPTATAVTADWLCTIRNDPRIGNCVGDSGGPVIKEQDGSFGNDVLVAVVSGGVGCGNVHLPDQNQRITYHLDWITTNMCEISTDPPDSFNCPGVPTTPTRRPTPAPVPVPLPTQMPNPVPTQRPNPAPIPAPLPTQRPTPAPVTLPTQKPNAAPTTESGLVAVVIVIEFDDFPRETGWLIADADYDSFLVYVPWGAYPPGTKMMEDVVYLQPGMRYFFSIEDKIGDGMCCKGRKGEDNADEFEGVGQFAVLYNGEIIVSGSGDFGFSENTYFTIPSL